MSTFNPLIPTGLVYLSSDYKNLQNNFQQLDTSFGINHFLFSNQTANNGKHTFVEMVNNTSIPGSLAAGEATLYSIQDPTSHQTDLYITPDNSGDQYQLTRMIHANIGTFGNFTNYPPAVTNQKGGWTFLPGGLLLQYGMMTMTGSSTAVAFPIAFTDSSSPYSLTVSTKTFTSERISTQSQTGFTLLTSSGSGGVFFWWMAIGV